MCFLKSESMTLFQVGVAVVGRCCRWPGLVYDAVPGGCGYSRALLQGVGVSVWRYSRWVWLEYCVVSGVRG